MTRVPLVVTLKSLCSALLIQNATARYCRMLITIIIEPATYIVLILLLYIGVSIQIRDRNNRPGGQLVTLDFVHSHLLDGISFITNLVIE